MSEQNRDLLPPKNQREERGKKHRNGVNYILGIAVDDYTKCTKLRNAVYDVESFIEIMTNRYDFHLGNVTKIYNGDATKRNIELAFLNLSLKVTNQDNLIVYFSGHGRHHEKHGGSWIPFNAENSEDAWVDYVSNDSIKNFLTKIDSFHTFLIADSCFSGSIFIDKSKEKFSGDRLDTEPSRWGLTSGKKEIVSDGEPGKHSPFAIELLDVLKKANTAPGVMKICDLVLERVIANSNQTPMGSPLQILGHKGGQMVFKFNAKETEEWEKAQKENTLDSYLNYLLQYPFGLHNNDAEYLVWDLLPKTPFHLERYILEHPNSPVLDEAKELLKELKIEVSNTTNLSSFVESTNTKFVYVEGKTFIMGDYMADSGDEEEEPHDVEVDSYYMAVNPVTFEEYMIFCNQTKFRLPHDNEWGRGKRPVINVKWIEAIEYCNWLSKSEGLRDVYKIEYIKEEDETKIVVKEANDITYIKKEGKIKRVVKFNREANGYRLPSEAEWEYASRGKGEFVRFGNGRDIANAKEMNFNAENADGRFSLEGNKPIETTEVGVFNCPNAIGINDMSGNVWEWCWDWFDEYFYQHQDSSSNPVGPKAGTKKIIRGGAYNSNAYNCRVTNRGSANPNEGTHYIGFRICKNAPKNEVPEISHQTKLEDYSGTSDKAKHEVSDIEVLKTKKIFISYCQKDEALFQDFIKQMSGISRQGKVETWQINQIKPGEEHQKILEDQIRSSDIILLLISSDFIFSEDIWDLQVKLAMERYNRKEVKIVPIIIRACDWQEMPFGKLQCLPYNQIAITSWGNIDEAWLDVIGGIKKML